MVREFICNNARQAKTSKTLKTHRPINVEVIWNKDFCNLQCFLSCI